MTSVRLVLGMCVGVGLVGCGSDATSDSEKPSPRSTFSVGSSTVSTNETWGSGKVLSGRITIPAGVTVTIEPGATLQAEVGTFISVRGTVRSDSASGTHARITGKDGWGGFIVEQGGTLSLHGVDLDYPYGALDVQTGAALAEYKNGTMTNPGTVFRIMEGSVLTLEQAKVLKSSGLNRIKGKLIARFIDFETIANDSIILDAPTAEADIEDALIHGMGNPTDLIVGNAGKLKLSYAELFGSHCGFHINNLHAMNVHHVTFRQNTYGMMLHGSTPDGPFQFANVNFVENSSAAISEAQGSNNAAISVQGGFFEHGASKDTILQEGSRIQIVEEASAKHEDAHPRI